MERKRKKQQEEVCAWGEESSDPHAGLTTVTGERDRRSDRRSLTVQSCSVSALPTRSPRARLTVEESHSEQEWPESNTPASAGTSRWVHRCHCWRLSPEYIYHRKFS